MGKWKSGKELLKNFEIKDFELFHDYVRKGLQPHDKAGRPISPSDVVIKSSEMGNMKKDLKTLSEIQKEYSDEDSWERISDETEKLENRLSDTERLISSLEDKDWSDYDLPPSEEEATKVISELVSSQYSADDFMTMRDELSTGKTKSTEEKIPAKKDKAPKERKPTHRDKQRLKCRAIAKEIWKDGSPDREMTIESAINLPEMLEASLREDGIAHYMEKTVREWIKDLCPNRKPGRRPGT